MLLAVILDRVKQVSDDSYYFKMNDNQGDNDNFVVSTDWTGCEVRVWIDRGCIKLSTFQYTDPPRHTVESRKKNMPGLILPSIAFQPISNPSFNDNTIDIIARRIISILAFHG